MDHLFKKTSALTLAVLLGSMSANLHANSHSGDQLSSNHIGSLTEYGQLLQPGDGILYVNVLELSPEETEQVRSAYMRGVMVLLDGTEAWPELISEVSMKIGGMGVSSPVLLLSYNNGKPVYHSLMADLEKKDDLTRANKTALNQALLNNSDVKQSLVNSTRSAIKAALRHAQTYSAASTDKPYSPEYTYTTRLTRNNFSCNLKEKLKGFSFDGSPDFDACKQKGNIDLAYTVDWIRSVKAQGEAGSTEDAKFVRISVMPESGGTGIYLADNAEEKTTWRESAAHRDSWFGPFVNQYKFSIASDNSDVWLKGHKPEQINPGQTVTTKTGINVGVGVSASADHEGPKGEVTGSFSYTSERSITQTVYEYTVENHSGSEINKAAWVWDRDFDKNVCSWLTREDFPSSCYFSGPLWDESPVFNKGKFSAISHKNFVPGFSATYQTSSDNTGKVNFKLKTELEVMGLGGKVIPGFVLASLFQIHDKTTDTIQLDTDVAVDFSHPYFEPEPHVLLQSLSSNICLDVRQAKTAEGTEVIGDKCHGGRNQLWGLDGKERYRSRVAQNRCLAVDRLDRLSIQTCNDNLEQKWEWEGDKLMSRFADGTGNTYMLGLDNGKLKLVTEQGQSTRWKPYLTNPK